MRLYAYLAILMAVIGSYYGVYRLGVSGVEARDREAILEAHLRENEAILQLAKVNNERSKVLTKTIEVIRSIPDSTGCLDLDLHLYPALVERVRNASGSR